MSERAICSWKERLAREKSDLLVKKNKSLQSLFFNEWPERITHGRSFANSEESKSLLSLFKKSDRAKSDMSHSLFWNYKRGKLSKSVKKFKKIRFFSSEEFFQMVDQGSKNVRAGMGIRSRCSLQKSDREQIGLFWRNRERIPIPALTIGVLWSTIWKNSLPPVLLPPILITSIIVIMCYCYWINKIPK